MCIRARVLFEESLYAIKSTTWLAATTLQELYRFVSVKLTLRARVHVTAHDPRPGKYKLTFRTA
eukprot:5932857-Amphidinium_carterae.1